jgi:hypothetical protein
MKTPPCGGGRGGLLQPWGEESLRGEGPATNAGGLGATGTDTR